MSSQTHLTELDRGNSLRLHGPHRIVASRGTLWLTVDGDPEDLLLEQGSSVRLEGFRPALVTAIDGSARVCSTPLSPLPLAQRLRHWLHRGHGHGGHSGHHDHAHGMPA